MRSRLFVIALPFLALAAPAAAQDVVFVSGTGDEIPVAEFEDDREVFEERDEDISQIADKMDSPLVQDGVSATIERMAGAMLDMRVGPLAEAIERARPGTIDRRIGRNSTVGDLAGRDTDYLPERLGDQSREAMSLMGGFARAMAAMVPEVERMGREMEDSFREAKREARRR